MVLHLTPALCTRPHDGRVQVKPSIHQRASRPLERFERLIAAQNDASTAYHTRKIGRIERCLVVGPSKKDPTRLTAKALDNVTVNAPMPPDYDAALYAREPWLDIEIATAHVWGNSGSIRGRAARFADRGSPVALPVLSLL